MTFDKLYQLLTESTNKHSWIDSNGEFHALESGETHTDWAYDYYAGAVDNPLITLMRNGWQRVSWVSHVLFAHNDFKLPNIKQIKKLKELAYVSNFEKLEWDGGERNRVLWTQNDIE